MEKSANSCSQDNRKLHKKSHIKVKWDSLAQINKHITELSNTAMSGNVN